jgi:camphor 5-monooxygenase
MGTRLHTMGLAIFALTAIAMDRTIDIDMFAVKGIEQGYHDAWVGTKTSGMPDLIWTPHNSGHWLATNFRTINEIYSDPARFSSEVIFMPKEAGEKYAMVRRCRMCRP